MGYLHIDNLYAAPEILECYALEKIHGTSAHVRYRRGNLSFFAGGESHDRFVSLFNLPALESAFQARFTPEQDITIFGEAFGGKQQGMAATYGKDLRFLAFDAQIDGVWLDVASAAGLAGELGIGFVPYERGQLSLSWLDAQRDRDSLVAVSPGKLREGVVIRPVRELFRKDGSRFIFKHKRAEFRETKTHREVDLARVALLTEASAIAEEYVTPMRLQHVLQRVTYNGPRDTPAVIRAMQEDVEREGKGEVVWSRDVASAIGRATAMLLKKQAAMVLQRAGSADGEDVS